MGVRSPSSTTQGPPAPGSNDTKVNTHNFWLKKPAGIESVEETAGSPKQFLLKNPHTDLLRLNPSELQHQGSSLKGSSSIEGETEVSVIKASRGQCPFSKSYPHRAGKLVPYLRLHQPG